MIPIRFIVNGEEESMDVAEHELLSDVLACVLSQTKNASRPAEEWEVRRDNGILISQHLTIGQLSVAANDLLFVTLRIAAGGAHS